MEEKEDKGFVMKDSRKISLDDLDKEPEPQEAGPEDQKKARKEFEETSRRDEGSRPLPEVTISTFVFSLSSSALLHLGEIPDPETGQVLVDLSLAKQIIDTLGMLQDKTKGNLEADEERLLRSVLYDLRMRYVQKSGGK